MILKEISKLILPIEDFKIVVKNTPLISIDFIVRNEDTEGILLGKRVNKPAFGYYFTLGGRVLKDESIEKAQKRIFKNELGFDLNQIPKFLGIFEHFYNDSFVDDNISTHYVNMGYEINISQSLINQFENLPKEQHSYYKWFSLKELLNSNEVHKYTKDYFSKIGENK